MTESTFQVNQQSPATRCEICHKSEVDIEPTIGLCERCASLGAKEAKQAFKLKLAEIRKDIREKERLGKLKNMREAQMDLVKRFASLQEDLCERFFSVRGDQYKEVVREGEQYLSAIVFRRAAGWYLLKVVSGLPAVILIGFLQAFLWENIIFHWYLFKQAGPDSGNDGACATILSIVWFVVFLIRYAILLFLIFKEDEKREYILCYLKLQYRKLRPIPEQECP